MKLVSEGISGVEVFGLGVGVFEDGSASLEPNVVLIKWRSVWDDKLYQVYVNGRFVWESEFASQREAIISFENQFDSAVRFEVFAVDVLDSGKEYSGELENVKGDDGRIEISFLKNLGLCYQGFVEFYVFGDGGDVFGDDNLAGIVGLSEKFGFGTSRFGVAGLGYDGEGSLGFGAGVFGENEYGFDFGYLCFRSGQLLDGDYVCGVKIKDEFGNESFSEQVSGSVRVMRSSEPAGKLAVSGFNVNENELVLSLN